MGTLQPKLRAEDVAKYLNITTSTLAKMRLRGDGPPYIKAGKKMVLYDIADVDKWLRDQVRTRTTS